MSRSFLIYPDIFGGRIRAFFTGIVPGVDRKAVCGLLEIADDALFMPIQRHTADIIALTGKQAAAPAAAGGVIAGMGGDASGVKSADCVAELL
nr:hypothetical protein [Nitrospiraceae bacterium]